MTKLTIAKHFRTSLKKDIGLNIVPNNYNITAMTQEAIIKHFRIPTNKNLRDTSKQLYDEAYQAQILQIKK